MEENSDNFSSQWNPAAQLMSEMMDLQRSADLAFVKDEIPIAFNCMRAKRMLVSASFTKEELRFLEDMEVKLEKMETYKSLARPEGFTTTTRNLGYFKKYLDAKKLFIKYSDVLNEDLQNHDLQLPQKADTIGVRY